MEKLIILNHKMNLEYDEVYSYIERFNKIETNYNIVVLPSSLYLESFMNHCTWGVGAQNVFYAIDGNYTGEISTLQLKSLGVEYAMIGHFERKKYFHETNSEIHKKLEACLDANIMPILCLGETGKKEDIISSLEELLEGITNIDFIIFAYEPLKANVEDIKTAEEQINMIYDYLKEKYHSIPNIVYGGGINLENISSLLKLEKLNGILIGKLSAKIEKIEKVMKTLDKK